jgi:hypothetical protein
MVRILQIFIKKIETKTLLKWYIKTGHKHTFLLNEVKKRQMTNDVYSLTDEDNVLNKHFMLQVNKNDTDDDTYKIAIHTSLTYVLVNVSNTPKGKVKYEATISEVITSDKSDYLHVKDVVLPNMFIEFWAYGVEVQESKDCKKTLPIKKYGVSS